MMMLFKLYANCVVVNGFSRSIICDLQRGLYINIPDPLIRYFKNDKIINPENIKLEFHIDSHNVIDEYFEFLGDKDIIYNSEDFDLFPPLDLKWDYPFEISNAIIEIKNFNTELFYKTIDNLDRLYCKYLSIWYFGSSLTIEYTQMSERLDNAFSHSVEFYINYESYNFDFEKFVENTNTVLRVFVHSSPVNKTKGKLVFTTKKFSNKDQCGVINSDFFSLNIETFSEALHNNSCLNRKISVDAEGFIRNCPSMSESFGNIKDTTLEEAISHPNFKRYWSIKKDDISKCKDCEFRYICTDCRAYVEDPQDTSGPDGTNLSKPLKCGYNPYTGEWSEWSTNPLKQKAIDFYGMREMVEDINKLKEE